MSPWKRIQTCGKSLIGARQKQHILCAAFCRKSRGLLYVVILLVIILAYISRNSSKVSTYLQQNRRTDHLEDGNATTKQHVDRYLVDGNVTTKKTIEIGFKHVNPHDYHFIISEKDKCKNDDVFLLIAVCISNSKFDTRQAIRNTWGSVASQDQTVRVIFVLGKSTSSIVQDKIQKESAQFQDIIQEDFIDSYLNLTLKSVAMLKWVSMNCRQASYVIKVDDDVFLNVELLLRDLKLRKYNKSIMGYVHYDTAPINNKRSKFYTSPKEFNRSRYPDYQDGPCYVISGDIVQDLYDASLDVPFFKWEDVFISGLCRLKINATLINNPKLSCYQYRLKRCQYRTFMCGKVFNYAQMKTIWEESKNNTLNCMNK